MRKSFKSFQSSRHFLHSNLGDEAAQMIFAEILIFEDGEKNAEKVIIKEDITWKRNSKRLPLSPRERRGNES